MPRQKRNESVTASGTEPAHVRCRWPPGRIGCGAGGFNGRWIGQRSGWRLVAAAEVSVRHPGAAGAQQLVDVVGRSAPRRPQFARVQPRHDRRGAPPPPPLAEPVRTPPPGAPDAHDAEQRPSRQSSSAPGSVGAVGRRRRQLRRSRR